MNGYQALATRSLFATPRPAPSRLRRALPSIAGGAFGYLAGGAHPILGALLGSAVARSAVDLVAGDTSVGEASRQVGAHAVATVGALATPVFPPAGYVVGVMIGNAVFGAAAPSLDDVRAGRAAVKRGQRGDAVTYVQALVGVVADGDFGPKTEDAVKVFQIKINVPQTGVVDQKTMAGLDRLAGGTGGVSRVDFSAPALPVATLPPAPRPATQPWAETEESRAAREGYARQEAAKTAALVPLAPRPAAKTGFLAAIEAPLWKGAPINRWQGAVLGAGVVAVIGAGIALLTDHHAAA